ncbi:hypothetical protein GQ602_002943 [Ophiocordyceps camponoti-floridani]|uniref:Uncharacterized protein n=1 Tax=Ophiocordyceps camponoti-floridani TaxID=2030778 RepID=A0A8H4Q752_9HYPO|nr:hypothetical protein GQ602_002943 [Ophiocordyceps camponoti-floridani]
MQRRTLNTHPATGKTLTARIFVLLGDTLTHMEHDAVPQPPDFPFAANGLRQAADQLERCAHLPAVMQALMERFDRLEHNMRREFVGLGERIDGLDQRVGALDHKVGTLDQKLTAANKNTTARTRNSVVTRRSDDLSPLYNATTGERITRFPRRLRDLENLTEDRVDAILAALGEPVEGEADERKRWLKYAVGVTTQVV